MVLYYQSFIYQIARLTLVIDMPYVPSWSSTGKVASPQTLSIPFEYRNLLTSLRTRRVVFSDHYDPFLLTVQAVPCLSATLRYLVHEGAAPGNAHPC
jgi:hypothetical protein